MKKIAIIREGKNPPDSRTPLAPAQCRDLQNKNPELEIIVQSSPSRCFSDDEYAEINIPVAPEVQDADILLGVKEVPVENLIPGKTYLFFSHTIKKQPYNRKLLQEIIRKKIRLIDYECLTDEKGIRVIAFGKWAGVVGAHNGLYAWGRKTGKLDLKRAFQYPDYAAMKNDYLKTEIPQLRILLSGDGRVAGGAVEVLDFLKIKRLTPDEYLNISTLSEPVYVQLSPKDIYREQKGKPFDLKEFFGQPQNFICDFKKWYACTDLFINAIFWDPRTPRYFSFEEMNSPDFTIKTIADISCDINGSVPATIRASTIESPVYGFDPHVQIETAPYLPHSIDIMAVDNLPNELPRDASESFGEIMADNIIPELLQPSSAMIERATIAKDGKLTSRFEYLSDYVNGK